jgi:hypothetical protein
MKHIFLFISINIVLVFSLQAQDPELLDRDNGFLGVKLCQNIDSMRRMISPVPISGDEKEHTELYKVIKRQYYSFGSAQFKAFTLSFFNDELESIFIDVTFENADIFLKELESVYGPGLKPSPKNELYYWRGKSVTMQYINAGGNASVTISSNIMKKKKDLWKNKQIEKSFDGF